MGWGTHPDTLTIARAQGIAKRQGFQEGTLEYQKAYRAAYEEAAGAESRGLAEHLKRLDDVIDRWEGGSPPTSPWENTIGVKPLRLPPT